MPVQPMNTASLPAVFALFLCLATTGIWAGVPLPPGSSKFQHGTGSQAIRVYAYKPQDYEGRQLLVVMHGVNRNARDYRDWSIALAQQLKALVIAPEFDKKRFPKTAYQQGGLMNQDGTLNPPSEWTYTLLLEIIDQTRLNEGRPALPYSLLGHSAGGQFLTRFAAFSPHRAERIVAANPGSLLFPRTDWPFGYGFGGLSPSLSDEATLRRYLASPLTLYLGTADISTTQASLDKSAAALLQGSCRLERGRNAYEFARKLSAEKDWCFHWQKIETPGIAHDAQAMFAAPEILQILSPTP